MGTSSPRKALGRRVFRSPRQLFRRWQLAVRVEETSCILTVHNAVTRRLTSRSKHFDLSLHIPDHIFGNLSYKLDDEQLSWGIEQSHELIPIFAAVGDL